MKKSTGIIFVLAAAIAAYVYFYDLKHTKPTDANGDSGAAAEDDSANAKPAYAIASTDIASLTVERGGSTIVFEQRADGWYMTQPLQTRAEQSVVGAIASELASTRVDRTLPAAPDRMATYGLTTPPLTLEFKLKNGTQHKLQGGAKDFSGSKVYAIVDGSKDVALLSDAILISSDKPPDDFR